MSLTSHTIDQPDPASSLEAHAEDIREPLRLAFPGDDEAAHQARVKRCAVLRQERERSQRLSLHDRTAEVAFCLSCVLEYAGGIASDMTPFAEFNAGKYLARAESFAEHFNACLTEWSRARTLIKAAEELCQRLIIERHQARITPDPKQQARRRRA